MMEELLLLLLLTHTIRTSFVPFVTNDARSCSGSHTYFREELHLCCSRCPPGHKLKQECTENTDSVCEPCAHGQYMEGRNFAPNCNSCSRCKHAKGLQFVKSCSPTSNAECGCISGRFCLMRNNNIKGCQECVPYKTCKPGFGVSVPGTEGSDVKCQKCEEGTFSALASSTDVCKPHTPCEDSDVIVKGTASSDTVCRSVRTSSTTNGEEQTAVTTTTASWRNTTAFQSEALPELSTGSTDSTDSRPILTQTQLPDSALDKQLAVVLGAVVGGLLLLAAVILLVLCKRVSQKRAVDAAHQKVDANGNCEMHTENTNLLVLRDTPHLSVHTEQTEKLLLQNGTDPQLCLSSGDTDESDRRLQMKSPAHPLESVLSLSTPLSTALSETVPLSIPLSTPASLQSDLDPSVNQNISATPSSCQPTSPQNTTSSPLVNLSINLPINLHIGNGTCGGSPVNGTCGGTPANGTCGGTPANGACGGTPANGACGGTPANGTCGGTPANGTCGGTPANGTCGGTLGNTACGSALGNGACGGAPGNTVLLTDMSRTESTIPFGAEEDGKHSLLSVEESGHFSHTAFKTEHFV